MRKVPSPSIQPQKPKSLPRPGQRTYLGCAYLYIERAMTDLSPRLRPEVAKDLKAYIDLLASEMGEAEIFGAG
jgi:hypothetical protein